MRMKDEFRRQKKRQKKKPNNVNVAPLSPIDRMSALVAFAVWPVQNAGKKGQSLSVTMRQSASVLIWIHHIILHNAIYWIESLGRRFRRRSTIGTCERRPFLHETHITFMCGALCVCSDVNYSILFYLWHHVCPEANDTVVFRSASFFSAHHHSLHSATSFLLSIYILLFGGAYRP